MATLEPVDPAFGGAARTILVDSLWATLREALQPLAGTFGITLPLEILQPPAGWVPLDQLVAQKLTEFFVYIFGQGTALYNQTIAPMITAITSAVSKVIPSTQSLITAVQQAFATLTIDTTAVTNAVITVIRSSLANAINTAYANLSNAAASITDPIIQVIREVQNDAIDIYNFVSNDVIRAIVVAQQYAQSSYQAVGNLTNAFNYYIPQIFQKIVTGLNFDFSSIANQLLPQVSSTLNAFITQANSIVSGLAPQIQNTLQSLITQATDTITNTANSLSSSAQTAVNYALSQLSELETYISTEFKYWVGEEGEYIINSLRGQQQGVGQVQDSIFQLGAQVQQSTNYIVQTDQQFYTDLAARIDNGWVSFRSDLPAQISAGLGGIWSGFQTDVLEPAGTAIGAFFGGIWDRLKSFFSPVGCEFQGVADWFGGIFNTISTWIQDLCGSNCSNMGKDPFNIITRSLSSVLGVGGGLGLSLMAGELVSPLKQLGMSRLSAYIWDMADFRNVGGDVLRALNGASTVRPLVYGLNEFFRPEIPRTMEANTFYHKGIISEDQWRKIYAQHGLANEYINQYYADIWTEPSDRMVIALIDTPGVPEDWIDEKLRARGYSDRDRQYIKLYGLRRRTADEITAARSAIENLYIDGVFTEDDLAAGLRSLGYSEGEIAWSVYATVLRFQRAREKEDIDILIQAYRSGQLDLATFTDSIHSLGLVAARADNIIEKEQARRKVRIAVQKAASIKKLSVTQVFQALKADLISQIDAQARLEDLNYTPTDAQLLIAIFNAGNEITG